MGKFQFLRNPAIQAATAAGLVLATTAGVAVLKRTSATTRHPTSLPADMTLDANQVASAFRGGAIAWKINSARDFRAQGQLLRLYHLAVTNKSLFATDPAQAQAVIEQAGVDYETVFSQAAVKDGRQPQSLRDRKRRKPASRSRQQSLIDLMKWLPETYTASAAIVSGGGMILAASGVITAPFTGPIAIGAGGLAITMGLASYIKSAIDYSAPSPLRAADGQMIEARLTEKINAVAQKVSQLCETSPQVAAAYNATLGQRTGISSQSSLQEIAAANEPLANQPALLALAKAVNPDGSLRLDSQQITDIIQQSFRDAAFLSGPEKQALLQEAHAAAQDRVEATQQQRYRFRVEGAYASVNVTGTLLGFVNPELGLRVSTVGSGFVKAHDSIRALHDNFAHAEGGWDRVFSTSIFMQDALSIGLQIFGLFRHPGPTPEQVILDGIRDLRQEMADLGQQMHDRFDRVDRNMNEIYLSMLMNFQALSNEVASANRKLDRIENSLANLNLSLDRLENRIHDYIQTLADRGFDAATVNCFNYWGQKHIPLEVYRSCVNLFSLKAVNYSQDALAVVAPPTVDHNELARIPDDLGTHPERHLAYLANLSLNAPTLADQPQISLTRFTPYRTLSNPIEWALGAQNFVRMAQSQPDYLTKIPVETIDQVINRGEAISDFLRALTRGPGANGVEAKRDLIDNLMAAYLNARRDFVTAWKAWLTEVPAAMHLPSGVDPFAGVSQLPTDVKAAQAQSSVPKCEGTQLSELATQRGTESGWRALAPGTGEDDRYQALPDKYKANEAHDLNFSLSPHPTLNQIVPLSFRQAEYLKLGQIKYCWSSMEWKRSGAPTVYYSRSRQDVEPDSPDAYNSDKFNDTVTCVNKRLKALQPMGWLRWYDVLPACGWSTSDLSCEGKPCLKFRQYSVDHGMMVINIRATFESNRGSQMIGEFKFPSFRKDIYFRRFSEEQAMRINGQTQGAVARGSGFVAFPHFYQESLAADQTNWPLGYSDPDYDSNFVNNAGQSILFLINEKLKDARTQYASDLKNSLADHTQLGLLGQRFDGSKRLLETIISLAMPTTLERDDYLRSILYGNNTIPGISSLREAVQANLTISQQQTTIESNDSSQVRNLTKYLDDYFNANPLPSESYPFINITLQALAELKTEHLSRKSNRDQVRAALSRLQNRVRDLTDFN